MATWRGALKTRTNGITSRIYWGDRTQLTTLPALVIEVVSDDRPQHLKGFDLAPARVQFDAYAYKPEDAWEIIEDTLDTLVPGGTFSGHNFSRADVALGPRDIIEMAGTKTVYRVSMDLIFHHTEGEEVT